MSLQSWRERGSCHLSNLWIFATKRMFTCCHKDASSLVPAQLITVIVLYPSLLWFSGTEWRVGFSQWLVDCVSSRKKFFSNNTINFKFKVSPSPSRTMILLLPSEFCCSLSVFHFSLPPEGILAIFYDSKIPCFFWILSVFEGFAVVLLVLLCNY